MAQRTMRLSRRNFILAVGASSAAAAAALVAKSPATRLAPETRKRVASGYQETEHISNYYRTTKV
jgi:hypothetical protein